MIIGHDSPFCEAGSELAVRLNTAATSVERLQGRVAPQDYRALPRAVISFLFLCSLLAYYAVCGPS